MPPASPRLVPVDQMSSYPLAQRGDLFLRMPTCPTLAWHGTNRVVESVRDARLIFDQLHDLLLRWRMYIMDRLVCWLINYLWGILGIREAYLFATWLSGPFCTYFIGAGGCTVATKLTCVSETIHMSGHEFVPLIREEGVAIERDNFHKGDDDGRRGRSITQNQ